MAESMSILKVRYIPRVVFRYPVNFCGPKGMPLFFPKGDSSGWKRFAQLFNPFSKVKDIVISIGDNLSMIPRCINNGNLEETSGSSAYVIVLLVNSKVVDSDFSLEVFEDFTTKVFFCFTKREAYDSFCSCPSVCSMKKLGHPIF